MKLSKLFLMGAIALGMVACNNDDAPEVKTGDATMSLKITRVGTRATDVTDLGLKESNIKKLEVFVFNGDVVDGYKAATSATTVTSVTDITVTTGARTIIVVANAKEDLSSIKSKAALKAKIAADLENETLDNGLLMTSAETASFDIAAGKNYYGYDDDTNIPDDNKHSVGAPIALTRVPARVALVGATVNFAAPYTDWTFEPTEVFVYNARKQSNYFGTSLVVGDAANTHLSGIDLTSFDGPLKPAGWAAAWTKAFLKDDFTDLTAAASTTPIYYYVFENNDAAAPTVLTVKGKLKDGDDNEVAPDGAFTDAGGFTYYTMVVNGNLPGYTYDASYTDNDGTVKRNTQYNLSLTIKRPGSNDPTDLTAQLDVMVEVADWVVVNQAVAY